MLAALLLSAQATFLPLTEAVEADGVAGAAFLPDASAVLITHQVTPVTTLVPLVPGGPSGSVITSIGPGIAVTPDGATGIVLGAGPNSVVTLLDLPAMTVRATIPIWNSFHDVVLVDGAVNHAVIVTEAPMFGVPSIATIVDLSTASIVAEVPLGSTPVASSEVLALNGSTLVGRKETPAGESLVSIDLATGATQAELAIDGSVLGIGVTSDGLSCVAVISESGAFAMDASLLVLDPANLGVQTQWPVPIEGLSFCDVVFADDDQAVFLGHSDPQLGDAYRVTLASGLVQPLNIGVVRELDVNADSSLVWLRARSQALVIVDAATGSVLGEKPSSVFPVGLVPAPVGAQAIDLSYDESERIKLLDLSGAGSQVVADLSSSPDPQVDGPLQLELLAQDRAAVVASQSDDLRVVDLASGLVTGYLQLDREPTQTALRDELLLVAHGCGESLWVIDPSGPTTLAQVSLPGPALELHLEPNSTRAWVRIEGPQPGLAMVETDPTAAAVLAFTALAGQGNPWQGIEGAIRQSSAGESVSFDFPAGRAFAISATSSGATLEQIDLQAGSVSAALFVPSGTAGTASLRYEPIYQRLFAGVSGKDVRAFNVAGSTPVPLWEFTCPAQFSPLSEFGRIEVSADGQNVFAQLPLDDGISGCPGLVQLEAATGGFIQALEGAGLNIRMQRVADTYLFTTSDTVRLWREVAGQVVETKVIPAPFPADGVSLDLDGGRLVLPARLLEEGLYVASLQDGQVQSECSPAEPNATGQTAALTLTGAPIAGQFFGIQVQGLEAGGMLGYLLVGSETVSPITVGGSPSPLCLGGNLGRFTAQVQVADSAGVQQFVVETSGLPLAVGAGGILTGETWTFQSWYSDVDPSGLPRSNFSDALAVTFL